MHEGWKKVGRARTLAAPIFNMDAHWRIGDEGFTPTKDGGTCLRTLSMFRKEVH